MMLSPHEESVRGRMKNPASQPLSTNPPLAPSSVYRLSFYGRRICRILLKGRLEVYDSF